ncbi:MAG: hypothetical protein DWQ31_20560 [Planctomycetota bacterium]|nr:MAG: hypothetical protein DWQ31_20560 [Planctomycetota bacterium]
MSHQEDSHPKNQSSAERPRAGSAWEEALDRLVDGEMDEAERRELLRSLDGADDGWRRLALAFVEAQTWRGDLGLLVAEGAAPAPGATATATSASTSRADVEPAPSRFGGTPRLLLAMAASFLVALVIGLQFRTSPRGPADSVAGQPAGASSADAVDGPSLASTDTQGTQVPAPSSAPIFPVGEGTLADYREQATAPLVPPNIADILRRLGGRIRQRRAMMPVEMEDGTQMLMPVEEVEVDYIGLDAYQ